MQKIAGSLGGCCLVLISILDQQNHERKTFDTTRIGGTARRENLSDAISGLENHLALQAMRISSPLTDFEEHMDGPKDEGHEWK